MFYLRRVRSDQVVVDAAVARFHVHVVALRKVPGPGHQRLVRWPFLARVAGGVGRGDRPDGVRPVVLLRGGLILFRFLEAHYLFQLLESVLGRQAHGYHGYLGQGKAQTEQVRFSR